jgi:hypothetical protein
MPSKPQSERGTKLGLDISTDTTLGESFASVPSSSMKLRVYGTYK